MIIITPSVPQGISSSKRAEARNRETRIDVPGLAEREGDEQRQPGVTGHAGQEPPEPASEEVARK